MTREQQHNEIIHKVKLYFVHAGKVEIRELLDSIYDLVEDKEKFDSCKIYKDGEEDGE